MAAAPMHCGKQSGKTVTPGNIAYYTLLHLKSGRRSTGSSEIDVMASRTQLNGSTRLHSLHEVVAGDEGGFELFALQDVISNDHEDPATVAARKMDWNRLLDQLSHIEQFVVEILSASRTLREVARQVGVCNPTMQYYRRRILQRLR